MWSAIADKIAGLIPERRVTPKGLVKKVVAKASKEKRDWGDGIKPSVPSEYIVRINRGDWDSYYGTCRDDAAESLARLVVRRFDEKQFLYASPLRISLALDASLDAGRAEIDARFAQRQEGDSCAVCVEREKGTFLPAIMDMAVGCKDVLGRERKASDMLESAAATKVRPRPDVRAYLASNDGGLFTIHPGDTIGVVRRQEEAAPDVVLDGVDYGFCSQVQGVFGMDSKGWFYKNLGVNDAEADDGDGGWKRVSENDKVVLKDGATLKLATGPDLVFSLG